MKSDTQLKQRSVCMYVKTISGPVKTDAGIFNDTLFVLFTYSKKKV